MYTRLPFVLAILALIQLYLNGNSFTTWHVPQAAVYGTGIALPGAMPSTPTFVFNGTSNTWEFPELSQ